ncbi:MAG: hypothetical protein ACRCYS_06545, partial [Beijerinckiaceae bacterium]
AIARQSGIGAATLAARIKSGMSLGDATSKPVINKSPTHVVFGRSMKTSEIVAEYGIDKQVFNYRIRVKKMTAEQAILMHAPEAVTA